MNIFKLVFGDRFAEKLGKTLLRHFKRGDFPKELLQYPDINLLYCEFMYNEACRRKSPEGPELIDYLEALIAIRRYDPDGDSKKSKH